ncbi:hypothetical protein [Sulfitobacter sp.]|jgi:hypothetical protein|uniref:hypothetical protein n=1 Tax=Sulfitobacter sp. TaxID=1903071 RepID=UPI003565D3F8|tara:strand:+ start:554 stop:844 length:291 start_codon:yes stop_codon:yes gene_type:complete
MHFSLRLALCLPIMALAACEDMSIANDPVARAEAASQRSCLRAVAKHTGVSGGTINTTLPIVETNQYIVDLPGAPSWTCYTDETGAAKELILTRVG